jgi:dihydroorotate dehydrogenase
MRPVACRALAQMRQRVGDLPLVGVGGIHDAQSALAKFEAGANAVQLYSALVFGGLDMLDRVKTGLVAEVRKAGKKNISEFVGTKTDDWAAGRF